MTVVFDTHAFIKRLTAVGMPEAQAEVLAEQHARLIDERLATKEDLANLATKADLAALASDTKILIAEGKTEILRWLFGLIGFQSFIILGAVVALARAFR